MKQLVLIGKTDYTVLVKIRDDAGAPATGLDETDIDIAYVRVETDNDVVSTDVTPQALSALTDAHTDWGFEEVSATDHPGVYRLDIADAVFASGAWSAVVSITGTGLDPCEIEFLLVSFNPHDGVRMGLTALPNAAADAAGGLPISDAGGLDLDAQVVTKINSILEDTGTTLDGRIPAALGANGNMKADSRDYLGVASPAADTAGYPKVTVKSGTGTGEIKLTGGYPGFNWGDIANPGTSVNLSSTGFSYVENVLQDIGGSMNGSVLGSVVGNLGGDVQGNVLKKVIGGGATSITGIGAWSAGASGGALFLAASAPTNFSSLLINVSGHVSRVTLADTVTTLTGHTAQTGDVYALANGANGFVAIKADTAANKVILDKYATMIVLDGAVYQYTANALELGPAGGGGGGDASAANQAIIIELLQKGQT